MSPTARIVGYGGNNIGDMAYREIFPQLLPDYTISYSNHCGGNPDLLILGGGDVVLRPYTSTFTDEQAAQTVVISVSVTPDSDFEFLKKARRVVVRDFASQSLCLEQGVDGVERMGDLAFALIANPERGKIILEEWFDRERLDRYNKLVCVVPNAYTMFGGYETPSRNFNKALSVADDLAFIADNSPASFVFLPFSTQPPFDDRVACSFINSRTKYFSKNLVVYDRLDPRTTLDVMSACDVVVGGRLHSLIFAVIATVPFIALDHHKKITDFVEEVGRPWSFEFNNLPRNSVLQLLRDHLSGRSETGSLVDYSDRSRLSILASSFFCVNYL